MASIDFDDVSKRFPNGTLAVDEMNLTVDDGEFMIFVGPSGCGKTTALRMVAGLEEVTSGSIRIGDRVVNDVEPPDRDIAMVFQNYALYPHMSVADNMGFPLRMQRVTRGDMRARVREVAELLGIGELLARKPRELSGGQRQRVAMGRAIIRHPQVFLMDEPLSNLDAKLRVQMRGELAKLHRRLGVTTIYVTHDQTEAMTLGQRVVVLSNGLVQQVDTPQGLYQHPQNTFVASFIGSPPMNFIRGRLDTDGVALGAHRFTLPDEVRAALSAAPQEVLVGLRPEEFADPKLSGQDGLAVLPAEIEVTEQLGPETYAYFRVPGLDVVEIGERSVELAGALSARLDPRTRAEPGQRVDLTVNLARIRRGRARRTTSRRRRAARPPACWPAGGGCARPEWEATSAEPDPVARDVVLVELPAEPGRVAQLDRAALEPRPVGDEVPPDRVAVGMEALDEGAVRDRREQVRGDLRLLVMRHPHVESMCDAGHATPLRRTAGPRRVEVADVDGPLHDQLAAAGCGVLALPRADRHAGGVANVAHRPQVVVPAARLLEPDQVEVLDEPREANRLPRRPGLVRVGGEDEAFARLLPHGARAHCVSVGVEAADLQLHAADAELEQRVHLGLQIGVHAVVAADRDHRQARAIAAPQSPEGLFERLADRVPKRGVDAGAGDEPDAPVTEDVERRRAAQLPAALDRVGVLADELRRELVVHDAVDLEQARVLVAGVRLADDAVVGRDPHDDRRAMRHVVMAAVKRPDERHANRDRLHGRDAHRAIPTQRKPVR